MGDRLLVGVGEGRIVDRAIEQVEGVVVHLVGGRRGEPQLERVEVVKYMLVGVVDAPVGLSRNLNVI